MYLITKLILSFSSLFFSFLLCFPLVDSFINQGIEERGETPLRSLIMSNSSHEML